MYQYDGTRNLLTYIWCVLQEKKTTNKKQKQTDKQMNENENHHNKPSLIPQNIISLNFVDNVTLNYINEFDL